MSNEVVWTLLSPLILKTLDRLGKAELSAELELERERHPLIAYMEGYFRKLFAPSGGLTCPELEKYLRDMEESRPNELKSLVDMLVKEYCRRITVTPLRRELGERSAPWRLIARKER